MEEKDLQILIKAYKEDLIGDKEMFPVFFKLAEMVFATPSYNYPHSDPKPVLKDAAKLCVEKLERYDPSKGKAFNFFVTIIGCSIRQSNGCQRRLDKLKKSTKNW
jgi:hypothetical protein